MGDRIGHITTKTFKNNRLTRVAVRIGLESECGADETFKAHADQSGAQARRDELAQEVTDSWEAEERAATEAESE